MNKNVIYFAKNQQKSLKLPSDDNIDNMLFVAIVTFHESVNTFDESQCDQIGQNFAIWAKFLKHWAIFFQEKIAQ
jgi:hypothetical protein